MRSGQPVAIVQRPALGALCLTAALVSFAGVARDAVATQRLEAWATAIGLGLVATYGIDLIRGVGRCLTPVFRGSLGTLRAVGGVVLGVFFLAYVLGTALVGGASGIDQLITGTVVFGAMAGVSAGALGQQLAPVPMRRR